MHVSTLVLAALTSALAAAAPAAQHTKRACTVTFPTNTATIHLAKNPAVNIPQDLAFTVPNGAGGPCSLVATFPAGYPIASSGQTQVNVFDVDGPAAGAIVGTVTFASSAAGPTFVTINSFACRPSMRYRLELAGTQGAVDFAEGAGAGVAVTYNC
ncbi:hypothetical protein B0T22DRAFT_442582 [Podospora appendiculata]|uniref:Ubiquitin 3 binding protein But2 C-terminal domain-containing protein n=1 Tax=Podospora appendiculata TaxID=314037 RepID=A0AAE0X5B9_9PEZI|nr:hypothetical protein B0T22DRAFT_442582 [Podospora appendiculata]